MVLKPDGSEISGCSKLTIEKICATFYRKVLQQSQEASYITTLDLQREPFSPEPDSLFYYSFDSFEQRLTLLDGLVKGTDTFVLVIGEPGSGKTTLLERYLASIDFKWECTRIQTAAEGAPDPSNVLQDQSGYPAYVLQDSAGPIVFVDDAHRLPPEELKFLIQKSLAPGSNSRIKRLVLFGESELHNAVAGLTALLSDQPAVNKIYLPGLTEEETVDYLRHRLAIAGFEGELPLNSSEVKAVHQTSGGNPGSINEIVHNRIADKYSNKKEGQNMSQKSSATPRRKAVWIAVGIIVIVLLAAVWLFSGRGPLTPKSPGQKLAKTVIRHKVPPNRIQTRTVSVKKMPSGKSAAKPGTVTKAMPAPTAESSPVPDEGIKIEKPPGEGTATPEEVTTASLSEKLQPQIIQPREDRPESTDPQSETVGQQETKTARSQPVPKGSQPEAIRQQETKTARSQPVPKGSQPKAIRQPEVKPTPVAAGPKKRVVRREKWLLSQDGTTYTVQIIGVSKEESLLDFIERNQLLKQNEIAYYESTFRGKPWFQLLYGIYPDKQSARLAAEDLPEDIRQAGPWIRNLAAVQNAIGN